MTEPMWLSYGMYGRSLSDASTCYVSSLGSEKDVFWDFFFAFLTHGKRHLFFIQQTSRWIEHQTFLADLLSCLWIIDGTFNKKVACSSLLDSQFAMWAELCGTGKWSLKFVCFSCYTRFILDLPLDQVSFSNLVRQRIFSFEVRLLHFRKARPFSFSCQPLNLLPTSFGTN